MERAEPIIRRWLRPALWMLVLIPAVWLVARGVMSDLGANPIERIEDETGQWTLRLLAASSSM